MRAYRTTVVSGLPEATVVGPSSGGRPRSVVIMATPTDIMKKEHALIKRRRCENQIRSIHAFAQRSKNDPTLAYQLSFFVEKLDGLWVAFNLADENYLDTLLETDSLSRYSDDLVIEMLQLITFIKAISKYTLKNEVTSGVNEEPRNCSRKYLY